MQRRRRTKTYTRVEAELMNEAEARRMQCEKLEQQVEKMQQAEKMQAEKMQQVEQMLQVALARGEATRTIHQASDVVLAVETQPEATKHQHNVAGLKNIYGYCFEVLLGRKASVRAQGAAMAQILLVVTVQLVFACMHSAARARPR